MGPPPLREEGPRDRRGVRRGAVSAAETFDSHLHLTDARFDGDRPAVLDRAREAGVVGMVTVGTDPEDARRALALAATAADVWATAGLHPHAADRFSPALREALEELVGRPEVVAVGETGLDYHYDNAPREAQRESFRAHLRIAAERALPVVVHSREADADTAALIREHAGTVRGVLHCFTGGPALMEAGLEAGWHVSFSGIVTFVPSLADRVRGVPEDRLLIETDSPYLAPVPRRGGRNEPAFLPHTCRRVAEIRGVPPAEVAGLSVRNARAFYRLQEG